MPYWFKVAEGVLWVVASAGLFLANVVSLYGLLRGGVR